MSLNKVDSAKRSGSSPGASRRQMLLGAAGGVIAGSAAGRGAGAAPLGVAEWSKEHGRPIEPAAYGLPSKFE
ncbi:MAG TPA: hypothetical protein VHM01_13190, partial [Alphaproteobacteria bacterium]|nr:hypothetical protein [Alphaproteobacteria bacterium]